MTSVNSRCATFSADADGFVPSEGAVALVLKTREAAIRDRNHILGIVKSTNVQHDGRTQGLIAPNINAQLSLQRSLLRDAELRPSDIE
jgi:acyl transferase domain-containing protein